MLLNTHLFSIKMNPKQFRVRYYFASAVRISHLAQRSPHMSKALAGSLLFQFFLVPK